MTPRSTSGYRRAIPMRFVPAFPASAAAVKEWLAGLAELGWLRGTLDELGETGRRIVAVADASWSCAGAWAGLPERVTLLARCARNRALYALPPPPTPTRAPTLVRRAPRVRTPG